MDNKENIIKNKALLLTENSSNEMKKYIIYEKISRRDKQYINIIIKYILKILILLLSIIYSRATLVMIKNKNNNLRNLSLDFSEVVITVFGEGKKQIISKELKDYPDEIVINNETISSIFYSYEFKKEENIVIFRWNSQLTTCDGMFNGLKEISKIDLSNFDSSKINSTSYMFYQCNILEYINFGNFDTSSVVDMSNMFSGCNILTSYNLSSFNTSKVKNMINLFSYNFNLESIDLSNFDTSLVTNMKNMFKNCYKLTIINLSNFNTPYLAKIGGMFHGCTSLQSIDISNFDTSNVDNFESLFYFCQNLKSINLKNFNTKNAVDIKWMFCGCTLLTSLDLSNFNLSKAESLGSMFAGCGNLEYIDFNYSYILSSIKDVDNLFSGCKKLKSLDLSFLDISQITMLDFMFYNCENLQYLNISNFDISSVVSMNSVFFGCKSLKILNILSFTENSSLILNETFTNINELIYCIKDISKADKIYQELSTKNSINNCSNICFSINSKYIIDKNKCIKNCSEESDYKYEYKNSCYQSCNNYYSYNQKECIDEIPEGYYLNDSLSKTIDKCPVKCKACSNNSMEYDYCISCNDNYFPVIVEEENLKKYLNCYLECPIGYINVNNSCQIYNSSCEDNTLYEMVADHSCLEECSAYNFLNRICKGRNNSLIIKTNIINNIRKDIEEGKLESILSDVKNENKSDIEIYEDDITYQITSSYNQNKKKYDNTSMLKFMECEKKLKSLYDISDNETLIIFKVDIYEEGLNMPIVEYEIYHPRNYSRLDLSICEEYKINILVPVSINEDEFYLYDPSSNYYNDKCFPYSSINGTDIILEDRQNEYANNNLTLCQNDCELLEYDKDTKYVSCKCDIKNEINIIGDIVIDKDKLLEYFTDIKSIVNLEVMKCYYTLFTKEGLLYNIGSYILLIIIFIYITAIFVFVPKGYYSLVKSINKIGINELSIFNKEKKNINTKLHKKLLVDNVNVKKKNKNQNNKKKNDLRVKTKISSPTKRKNVRINTNINSFHSNIYRLNDASNTSISQFQKLKNLSKSPKKQKVNFPSLLKKNENNLKQSHNFNNLNDYELNSLTYAYALKFDKRTYFQYYLSLLKTKHKLIFTFCLNNDYNSKSIKICLFLFSFALYYTINAFFFTENEIHKIYEDSGNYDFIYNIPQILYSTIISSFINIIINFFSLSESKILEMKKSSNKMKYKESFIKLLSCLKIKFSCFFIISLLLLIVFWYYISCFCAVYKNTQMYLIQDTLISYFLSLLYPFGINLFPGLFRIPSLRDHNKNKECLFKFSKIIQLF